jgi:type VI secretion system secreted protein Hcp
MRMKESLKRIGLVLLLALGLILTDPALVRAKVDMFLKIDGIEGECVDRDHAGWIDAWDSLYGQSMPEDESKSAAVAGIEQAIPGVLTITKQVDGTSPKLAEFMAKGRVIPSIVLDAPRKDGKPGRVITTMKNVKIVSVTGSTDRSSEKVKFAYQSYRVDFGSTR